MREEPDRGVLFWCLVAFLSFWFAVYVGSCA
jgi:hypothetical protein